MAFDPLRHIGAVTRVVEAREHEGRPARVVVATRHYPTTAGDLWDALTNPERIPRWFLPVSGDLRLGRPLPVAGQRRWHHHRVRPSAAVRSVVEYGGDVSWLTVTLEREAAESTRLTLEHVAYVDQPRWDQYGPGAVGVGWDMGLLGLGIHVATREVVDPAAAAGWFASEAGKDFLRTASDDWARASIAAGTPRDAALDAAERTRAAYMGEQPAGT